MKQFFKREVKRGELRSLERLSELKTALKSNPYISCTTKIIPSMPARNSRIISNTRAQPPSPTVIDRNTKQPQINAPNDKSIVSGTLAINVRDSNTDWFSSIGHHCWLSVFQNWLHHERNSLSAVI
jgi:hypothetical protein